MGKTLLFVLFLLVACPVFAQKSFTISGAIEDAATGEKLIGATVKIKELPQSGTITNAYGFYIRNRRHLYPDFHLYWLSAH